MDAATVNTLVNLDNPWAWKLQADALQALNPPNSFFQI